DLDVHLQCGHTTGGTGYFKVHVTEVVFVTEDVGQNGKAVIFFHQTHCDTGNRRFQRYTGIHQCQAGTTDRSHGAGTIGFSDLTDNAQGVREAVLRRQNRSNTATGKTTVTDLTTTGCAHATTLAYRIGWEVVVQHEG